MLRGPRLPSLLLLVTSLYGIEPEDRASISSTEDRTGQSVCTENEFPPRIIDPETIRQLRKGAKIVCQVGGPGVHDGKAVGIIANTYEVELPGFEGKQTVGVEYIQGEGTIIGFKGPGFLYRAEGGQLVRKKLVRLSAHDINVLEKGIREAITSHGYAEGHRLFLVLRKDKASFSPSESFLKRLSGLDVALKNYRDWDPRHDGDHNQAVAEIVHSTPDRAKFCWQELGIYEDVKRRWACKFELLDGNWVKIEP